MPPLWLTNMENKSPSEAWLLLLLNHNLGKHQLWSRNSSNRANNLMVPFPSPWNSIQASGKPPSSLAPSATPLSLLRDNKVFTQAHCTQADQPLTGIFEMLASWLWLHLSIALSRQPVKQPSAPTKNMREVDNADTELKGGWGDPNKAQMHSYTEPFMLKPIANNLVASTLKNRLKTFIPIAYFASCYADSTLKLVASITLTLNLNIIHLLPWIA
ncbi:hypothetical protein BT96DRAFT_941253 [Gymnopus androsaceus JB14]|uniref:Uncharacterized protein n=1 Tax=Gymnopus androsaceus JB14 TaxID=1447944 RepID=A0A6A4HGG0_9AGAR|nr:hypothetical protein BT96DRAFT_941253 [Gymnopus androsaceus JB14]